jgi:hypothetical protein
MSIGRAVEISDRKPDSALTKVRLPACVKLGRYLPNPPNTPRPEKCILDTQHLKVAPGIPDTIVALSTLNGPQLVSRFGIGKQKWLAKYGAATGFTKVWADNGCKVFIDGH